KQALARRQRIDFQQDWRPPFASIFVPSSPIKRPFGAKRLDPAARAPLPCPATGAIPYVGCPSGRKAKWNLQVALMISRQAVLVSITSDRSLTERRSVSERRACHPNPTERLNRDAKNQRSAADEVFRPGVGVHGRRRLRCCPVFQQVRPQSSLHTQVVGQTALEVLAKDQASTRMAASDRLAVSGVRQGSARENPERGAGLEVAPEREAG